MLGPPRLGITRAAAKPDFARRSRYYRSVRFRPPVRTIIRMSPSLAEHGRFRSQTISSTTSSFGTALKKSPATRAHRQPIARSRFVRAEAHMFQLEQGGMEGRVPPQYRRDQDAVTSGNSHDGSGGGEIVRRRGPPAEGYNALNAPLRRRRDSTVE